MELSCDKDKLAIYALDAINDTSAIDIMGYTAELSIEGDIISIDMYGERDLPGMPSINVAKYKLERVA